MNGRWPWSWWAALGLAVLLGVGSHAAPVVPSAGRWQPDAAAAVHAESRAALNYLVTQPRTGDRIANSLYLALLEGEDAWAAAFLERQHAALRRATARFSTNDAEAYHAAALTLQTLEHYQALVAAGQVSHDAFQRLLADQTGPQLRQHALYALEQGNR